MLVIIVIVAISAIVTSYTLPSSSYILVAPLQSKNDDHSDLSFIESCERQVKRISKLLAEEGDHLNSNLRGQLLEAQEYLASASKARMASLSEEAKTRAHDVADKLKAEAQNKLNQGMASADEVKERAMEEAKHLLIESKGHLGSAMRDAEREAKHELKRRIEEFSKRMRDLIDDTEEEE